MRINNSTAPLIITLLAIALLAGCSPKEISWIALGDSITYLNEHSDETGNRITAGYMTRVVRKLPHIHYTNKGFNGWTAGDVAKEIDRLGLVKADVYTVFLGTNDWWRGRPIGTIDDYKNNAGNESFFGSLRIITDHLKDLNDRAQIILLTPMQRVDFVYIGNMSNNAYGSYREKNDQSLADFAAAILIVGELEGFKVIDVFNKSGMTHENLVRFKRLRDPDSGEYKNYFFPDFIDKPFNPLTDEYPYPVEAIDMTYDGLHPSDKGYEVIANMLIDVLK
jgi:lysophospholipase L1-like esterase